MHGLFKGSRVYVPSTLAWDNSILLKSGTKLAHSVQAKAKMSLLLALCCLVLIGRSLQDDYLSDPYDGQMCGDYPIEVTLHAQAVTKYS